MIHESGVVQGRPAIRASSQHIGVAVTYKDVDHLSPAALGCEMQRVQIRQIPSIRISFTSTKHPHDLHMSIQSCEVQRRPLKGLVTSVQ